VKLTSITLHNFRQFAGLQRFELQSDLLRPVTLIFGANGAGKTTLLNAFTWALYGSMSEDVEEQQRMVTDCVWRQLPIGATTEIFVELTFEHEERHYRLRRGAEVRKESDEQQRFAADLKLWETKPDGASEEVGAPQEKVYTILPRGVSRFFFFNGERIEKLVQKGAYGEVQQDIKVLLDLEQVERALDHLPKVDRKLTADLKKYGGQKASEIQTAIDDLREQEAEKKEQQKVLEADLATLNEEREAVTELLRQNAAAAPIQKARDTAHEGLAQARQALAQANLERTSLIASRGFLAFTEGLTKRTADIASALYERGTLPAPLKREFVDQLLEEGQCICGTPLEKNGEAHKRVLEWRQRAGLQAVETAWQQLRGQMTPIDGARKDLHESLQGIVKRVSTEGERVSKLEERISELDGQLKDTRLEGVQELESKRLDLDRRIGIKQQSVGSVKAGLAQIQKDIEKRSTERSRAQVTDELATKARTRSDLVLSVRRALEEILVIRSEEMRRRLDAELKEVFGKITIKRYIPRLSDTFELGLFQIVGGVELAVPKSTGENQILSLSFVAAVSKLAREVRKERRAEGPAAQDAGIYPIVMDAAFGSLDQNYQREVSRALAQMAPQLVVLVSKSQGLGQVVTELHPYVSHLGVIVTHTTVDQDMSEDIELAGVAHPYVRSAAEADHAELIEVS
jgi:DNA sulfur modification protein DndD